MYLCSLEKHFLMDYNELYDKALQIAIRAHAGQKDKAGHDYILHPIRVAERCSDPRAKIVALLHDTIEDSDVTAEYLREEGFTEEIVEAVLAVTRREVEEYDDYVHRAAQNELGRMVKRADLEDNMDIRRLPELTDRDVERLRKYLRAWQYIVE
jgi:(p)ppGpp synthase/HD superfamily hydrolase